MHEGGGHRWSVVDGVGDPWCCPECGLPLDAAAESSARRSPTSLALIVGHEIVAVGIALASVLVLAAHPDSVV